jgi:16S rRNA (guanine966-N2)-methyltransferase
MFMRCDGQRWCDMFAGSGAIGLEALSRGAKEVVFIEQDKEAFKVLRSNVETCKMQTQSILIHDDAIHVIHNQSLGVFDVIFMDPPYDMSLEWFIEPLLKQAWYDKDTLFVFERRSQEDLSRLSLRFEIIKQRKVGQSQYVIACIKV